MMKIFGSIALFVTASIFSLALRHELRIGTDKVAKPE
jgi:hypothetical protein